MRHILRAAALILALVPGVAAAQIPGFPQTLPANTVLGRTGIGPGPSQAIPFSVLRTFVGSAVTIGGATGPNFLLDPTLRMTGSTLGVVSGTFGPTIPLNSGNNSFTGNNIFGGTNSFTGANTFSGTVTLPNQPAYSWLLNNTNAAGAPTAVTIGALTLNGSPGASTTTLPCETAGVLGKCTAGALAGSLTTGIATFGGSGGPNITIDTNSLKMTGTQASVNTGTSGHAIPFLDGINTWSGTNNLFKPASGAAIISLADGVPTTTSTISSAAGLLKISNNAVAVELDANTNGGITGQLYLDTTGKVGIGTTGPTATVDVNGTAKIRSLTTGCVASDASGNLSTRGCDRTIWASDYGAVCNGVTNDATAFQNAINQGIATGYPVKFAGTCAISTALSITATVDFSGATGQSTIIPANTINGIIINANLSPVYLHDFQISYSSPFANAGTQAIYVTAPSGVNSQSRFWNMTIANAYVGVNYVNAGHWTLSNSIIANATVTGASGILVSDVFNPDLGDSTIYGNLIQGGSGGVGIQWASSGGLRIENNKFLGSNTSIGVQILLAPGASTCCLWVVGNSIEGITSAAVQFNRQGTTGGITNVVIANNELTGTFCVVVPFDANGVWINNMSITGNVCQTIGSAAATAFSIDSVSGLTAMSNALNGQSTGGQSAFAIGTHGLTAASCVIGASSKTGGAFGASAAGACTTIAPF